VTFAAMGLGGGIMPMAPMIARADLDIAGETALGHYPPKKSSVAAAAGLVTLDVIGEEGLVARASELGGQRPRTAAPAHRPAFADHRGLPRFCNAPARPWLENSSRGSFVLSLAVPARSARRCLSPSPQ